MKMCIFDAVMTRKSRFHGETSNIVVFGKILKFFLWYKCRKLHLKNDNTILSEDLNIDVTWALLRMQLACLIESGISPGNMQQIFSFRGYQSILNAAVLRLKKSDIVP